VLTPSGERSIDYCENYVKSINTLCVKTAEFINVKTSGGPSNSIHLEEFYVLG
jgi:hypothetical protein